MTTAMYAVDGMMSESCMAAVLENVHSLSGVTVAAMDLVAGGRSPLIVTSSTKLGTDTVRHAVEHVGFGVPPLDADPEEEYDTSEKSPKVTDPLGGMTVDPATAAANVEHEGHTFHFRGTGCAQRFRANHGGYTSLAKGVAARRGGVSHVRHSASSAVCSTAWASRGGPRNS